MACRRKVDFVQHFGVVTNGDLLDPDDVDTVDETAVLRALVPGVEASDAYGLEVSGVSCRDGHVGGLGDRGDERVVQWCVFGRSVGGEDSCGRKVEGQHPLSERGQHAFFEPPAQDRTLGRVGSLLGDDAAFDSAMVVTVTN